MFFHVLCFYVNRAGYFPKPFCPSHPGCSLHQFPTVSYFRSNIHMPKTKKYYFFALPNDVMLMRSASQLWILTRTGAVSLKHFESNLCCCEWCVKLRQLSATCLFSRMSLIFNVHRGWTRCFRGSDRCTCSGAKPIRLFHYCIYQEMW